MYSYAFLSISSDVNLSNILLILSLSSCITGSFLFLCFDDMSYPLPFVSFYSMMVIFSIFLLHISRIREIFNIFFQYLEMYHFICYHYLYLLSNRSEILTSIALAIASSCAIVGIRFSFSISFIVVLLIPDSVANSFSVIFLALRTSQTSILIYFIISELGI